MRTLSGVQIQTQDEAERWAKLHPYTMKELETQLQVMSRALDLMGNLNTMLWDILDEMPTCIEDILGEEGVLLAEQAAQAYEACRKTKADE